MNKLLLTACALGLLLCSASAQEIRQDEREDWQKHGLVKRELTRYIPTGKSRTLWFLVGAQSDCTPWALADVRITKEPEHGTVEFVPTEGTAQFAKDGPSAKCSGKKMRGQSVNYKASNGYSGSDEFELLVMWPTGQASEMRFNINVR